MKRTLSVEEARELAELVDRYMALHNKAPTAKWLRDQARALKEQARDERRKA